VAIRSTKSCALLSEFLIGERLPREDDSKSSRLRLCLEIEGSEERTNGSALILAPSMSILGQATPGSAELG
jgi:hypothetical protein